MYEQIKSVEAGYSDIVFVEFEICRAGHRPIGQSTYLLQVQLPHSGVVSARGSPHSVWLPHHRIHPSISQHDLHPPCQSLCGDTLVRLLIRHEERSLVGSDTGDLKDKSE